MVKGTSANIQLTLANANLTGHIDSSSLTFHFLSYHPSHQSTHPHYHPLLVLVISTSSYDSITYYHGLPYLLPSCFSFIAAL